jgi:hypothetical protein
MQLFYVVITIIAASMNGYAAVLNFVGAESVKVVADRVQVSRDWMIPLGCLLAAGAIGLLLGFAVPALGYGAATGLLLYFLGAIGAHVRVGDRGLGGPVFFLIIAVSALVVSLAYHRPW